MCADLSGMVQQSRVFGFVTLLIGKAPNVGFSGMRELTPYWASEDCLAQLDVNATKIPNKNTPEHWKKKELSKKTMAARSDSF